MAFTVVTDLTDFDLAESATPWSDGSLDAEFKVQGNNSIGWYASKNARGSVTVNPTDVSWATGDHLYFWTASSVAALMEAKTTGTTTASGVTVRVTLANGGYREWHVTGSDKWNGEWRCFVVSLDHTGSELYASSGSFVTSSDIASVTFYYDLSNSGNIRNVPANIWNDAVRIGTGVTAYNTSAADPSFDFSDIASYCEDPTRAYGISETKDGVIFLQGSFDLGDPVANHLDFDSQNEVVVFSVRDGVDGRGVVADGLYGITVQGNSIGSDQDFNMGVKVGTGDTATGRSGTLILAGSSVVRWRFWASDADIHNLSIYGSTLQGAYRSASTVNGASLSPTTLFEVIGNTFDACGVMAWASAVQRNNNYLNTQAGATEGAFRWDDGDTDIKNCLFVNNAVGIEIQSLTASITLDGIDFQGNTQDIRYEGASNYDANIQNASSPTIQNVGAGTLTAVANPVTLLVTVLDSAGSPIQGAKVLVEAASGGSLAVGTDIILGDTDVNGQISDTRTYASDQPITGTVRKASSSPYYKYGVIGGSVSSSNGRTVEVRLAADE